MKLNDDIYISDEGSIFDFIVAAASGTSLCCFIMGLAVVVLQSLVALPGASM